MSKKILIVEDEPLVLKALEFRLKKDGYDLSVARDGREGLQLLQQDRYDLVLTDLMMPFNNGMEIVNMAKNGLAYKTPVIVLSSMGLEATVLEAFRLGADDFITKPFSPMELAVRIARLIK
jgi:DNA-binding response OmpR family regulator